MPFTIHKMRNEEGIYFGRKEIENLDRFSSISEII